ncbi:hypothetical protein H6F96_10220 [Microcoleus sp. FACHB-53]|nr:hypothetical protein [Microcoleus sp. FACHB-53]
MLKKLTAWFIATVFIVQTLVQVNPAQAAPISPLNSTLLAAPYIDGEAYKLVFSDTNGFYQELADALKSNKEVKISTNYKSYADLPPRLKNIFKLDSSEVNFSEKKDTSCPPFAACAPIHYAPISPDSSIHYAPMTPSVPQLTEAPATINYKAIFFLGSIAIGATAGAGIGTFFGGIGAAPGAVVGGVFGLVSGVVAEAFTNQDHIATIKINANGELIISIEPAQSLA